MVFGLYKALKGLSLMVFGLYEALEGLIRPPSALKGL